MPHKSQILLLCLQNSANIHCEKRLTPIYSCILFDYSLKNKIKSSSHAEGNSRTHSFILFIYDISGYLLSQELDYLGQVFSWSFALGRTQILEGRKIAQEH